MPLFKIPALVLLGQGEGDGDEVRCELGVVKDKRLGTLHHGKAEQLVVVHLTHDEDRHKGNVV